MRPAALRALAGWHRWAGITACLAIVAWSVSGMLHPLMSRLQPPAAQHRAPAVVLPVSADLPSLLASQGIAQLQSLQPVAIADRTWLRIGMPGEANGRYVDPASGQVLAHGETAHAVALARHFSGEQQAGIVSVTRIDAFSDEYPAVNRLLPVWRVAFDREDRLRAFVDTAHSRLGTLVDARKYRLARTFLALHSWQWAEGSRLRVALMSLLLLATASTAIAGLVMAVRLRHARQRLARHGWRRWHRRLGIAVSLSAILFSSSGLYHLLHTEGDSDSPPATRTAATLASADLAYWPALQAGDTLSLQVLDGEAAWRIAAAAPAGPHAHHGGMAAHHAAPAVRWLRARDGATLDEAEARQAVLLARDHSGLAGPVQETRTVTAFGGEYGFINKRLPVVRVAFAAAGNPAVYVETASGELAAIVRDGDRAEGYSFAWLHKWQFMGTHKDLRDALLALFALGNAMVALLGLGLFLRR